MVLCDWLWCVGILLLVCIELLTYFAVLGLICLFVWVTALFYYLPVVVGIKRMVVDLKCVDVWLVLWVMYRFRLVFSFRFVDDLDLDLTFVGCCG